MENQENTNVTNETPAQETEAKTFTFTEEEFAALLQRETDKRVTSALKTQQKKFDKQLSLSRLDDDAREKAEKDARIQELEEMLRERDIANNKSELKSVLSARGLSAEFADIITISEDIEESQAKIDVLDKLFKAAVKNEVERRLAASGGTPKGNTTTNTGEITKEQFRKMSLTEQAKLSRDFPEVYKKLTSN
jgi:hypothetical protein